MKFAKIIAIVAFLSFAIMQFPATSHAVTSYAATINYVSSSNGTSWVNANVVQGATTLTNQNYVFPAAQANTMMAVSLSAIASGKTVQLQLNGGNWSNLYGIQIYP